MNQRIVSLAAVAICVAIFGAVALFGYTRYRAAQRENAEFQRNMQLQAQQDAVMKARMPGPLGSHTSSISAGAAQDPNANQP